jgi:uncharacterized damage-inducible protein DinB
MSLKDELRQELVQTREVFHTFLAEIPDEAFSKPGDNPSWTIGEVLFHMSLVPQSVFARLNDWYTRHGAQNLNRSFLPGGAI